jgi:formylglycine-generating enzyme required for sulfatase activity
VLAGHCYAGRPPGTVKVKFSHQVLYVDKRDIALIDWLEYVSWHNQWDSANFVMSHVDSVISMQSHKKEFQYMPVTGITREQAEAYCRWRTKVVNEHPKFAKSKKAVSYTLPTEAQCQQLSQKRKWGKQKLESNPFPTKGFRCIATISQREIF